MENSPNFDEINISSIELGKIYRFKNEYGGMFKKGTICLFIYKEYMSFHEHRIRISSDMPYTSEREEDHGIFGYSIDYLVEEKTWWLFVPDKEKNRRSLFFSSLERIS